MPPSELGQHVSPSTGQHHAAVQRQVYYIFAIIGLMLFGRNDPVEFGSLQMALISTYRLATFDNWSDLLCVYPVDPITP